MPMEPTLALFAASVGLMVFAGWRGGRAPDPVKGPRMVPWRMVMLLCAALASLLVIHLLALVGVSRPA